MMKVILSAMILASALMGSALEWNPKTLPEGKVIVEADGSIKISNPDAEKLRVISMDIELNQKKAAPVVFGCELRNEAGPDVKVSGWIALRVMYADGSKGKYQSCTEADHFKPGVWRKALGSWMPDKPLKAVSLVVSYNSAGTLYLRNFVIEQQEADGPEFAEMQGKNLPVITELKLASIPAPSAAAKVEETFTFQRLYPDANFIMCMGNPDYSPADLKKFDINEYLGRQNGKLAVPFEVSKDGEYTFLAFFASSKSIWNRIAYRLDGQQLDSVIFDGSSGGVKNGLTPYRAALPLKLTAGKHIMEIEYVGAGAYRWVQPDAFAVATGNLTARYDCAEFQTPETNGYWAAAASYAPNGSLGYSGISGHDFEIRIPRLSGAEFMTLIFSESMDFDSNMDITPGARVFDVMLDGKVILPDYDINARSDGGYVSQEKIKLPPGQGTLILKLRSKNKAPAKISSVALLAGDDRKLASYELYPPGIVANPDFASPYNLVGNPGFEYSADGRAAFWGLASGSAEVTTSEFHSGQAALKLAAPGGTLINDTLALASWDKPYEFQVYAKGSGRVRLRLIWGRDAQYTPAMLRENKSAIHKFMIGQAGVHYGEWQELKGGDWRKVVLSAVPPRVAERVGFSLEWEGEVLVDDFCFDGYGALPVEILYAQGGYELKGHKKAVIYTRGDHENGKFIIRGADNDIKYLGELQKHPMYGFKDKTGKVTTPMLDRTIWVADFSKMNQTGRFNLEVLFPDGQMQRSPLFEVRDGFFGKLGQYVACNYFPVIRCGTEVPGWHPPCHTDDADWVVDGKRRHINSSGGWHDAGDMNIFFFNVANCCVGFVELIKSLGPEPALVDELCWGLDSLLRVQKDNGNFFSRNNGGVPIGRPDRNTDGDPATPDNRVFGIEMSSEAALLGAYALLNGALFKPENAERYRQSAARAIEFHQRKLKIHDYPQMVLIGLTGQIPGIETEKYLEKLISLVNDGSCIYFWPSHLLGDARFHFTFAYAMLEYLRQKPDGKLAGATRQALHGYLQSFLIPLCGGSPFEQVQEHTAAADRKFFSTRHHYDISYRYYAGMILGMAAELFQDRQCLRLAESQILWGTGLNPTGISGIAGIGVRQQNAFNVGSNEFTGYENGQYPAATHHVVISNLKPADKARVGAGYTFGLPGRRGLPYGFQYALPLNDSPSFAPGAEQYIAHAAPFMAACGAIERAHRSFVK